MCKQENICFEKNTFKVHCNALITLFTFRKNENTLFAKGIFIFALFYFTKLHSCIQRSDVLTDFSMAF